VSGSFLESRNRGSQVALTVACILGAVAQSHAQQSDEEVLSEIVVTGSRIVRQDFAANTPIVTMQAESLQNTSSFALESKLTQLPQFQASGNTQHAAGFFNSGASTLNLRNLGDNRNLVLLDGRRLQPSTSAFAVDINTIPSLLVESVEVITGGASAVYGADAVSGVINFKLKRRFEGLQVDAQYGLSEAGDNRTVNVGALLGSNLADGRGNVVFALDYADRGEGRNTDRSFYRAAFLTGLTPASSAFLGTGYYKGNDGNPPSQEALDAYFAQFGAAPGSVLRTTNLGFNPDAATLFNLIGPDIYNYSGPLYPDYVFDTTTTPGRAQFKQNHSANGLISLPMTRYSLFGRAEYDVAENVTFFVQGMSTHYSSMTEGGSPTADNYWQFSIPRDAEHPVPAPLAALLDSRADPNANWLLGKTLTFLGRGQVDHDNDVWQVVAGFEGRLPFRDWTWEAYGSHGEMRLIDTYRSGFAEFARVQELLSAPFYGMNYTSPSGGTCTSGLLPFGDLNGPNVTLNPGAGGFATGIIGPNGQEIVIPQTVSQDCIDFISPVAKSATEQSQDVVEAFVQGGLFELPAGEVRFAAGAGYRRNSFTYNPDPLFTPDPQGASRLIGQFGLVGTTGSSDVVEGYVETTVPLLRDLPFVRALDISLAYRYSDYEHSGGSDAYKLDASWTVVDSLRIRGGYQRAVRAPNVIEQFSPPTLIFGAGQDPCQSNNGLPYGNTPGNPDRAQVQELCRALMGAAAPADLDNYIGANVFSLNSQPRGNPDLEPEEADTITVGFVFNPSWELPFDTRFTLAVDYYDIEIDGAIGYITASDTYQLCFNSTGVSNPTYDPNNPYCQTIRRATAPGSGGFPTVVENKYENQGGIKTNGVDLQLDAYSRVGPGTLGFNLIANYLDSFKRSVAPGARWYEYADSTGGYFKQKWYTTLSYDLAPVQFGLRWRYVDSVRDSTRVITPCTVGTPGCRPDTDSYQVFDLFGRYDVTEGFSVRAGVENLFDEDPPVVSGIPGNTLPSFYDILGRRYYVSFTARF